MTVTVRASQVLHEPLWFGAPERALFGWLSRPADGTARGGVLLAPPIGRESRAAHRGYRRMAEDLAAEGFAALRFDYDGTGDSSGTLDDPRRDEAWMASIASAGKLLRSLGLSDISAVGIRFGATLVGAAAAALSLEFSSVVLWDPCESGRSFLRELAALESMRRERFQAATDGSVETTEFVFSAQTAAEIRSVSLTAAAHSPLAERVLVMSRQARPMPGKLHARLSEQAVTWQNTDEQERFIDAEPLDAVLPVDAMRRMVSWLAEPDAFRTTLSPIGSDGSALFDEAGAPVRERVVQLGRNNLFGIVSEPVGEAHGPWIVALNTGNEHHIGPSRQWVELSRRWAAHGLRCLRFDVVGLGDSPLLDGLHETTWYDRAWLDDVPEAVRALTADPSDAVFIGLCSGGYSAIEAALELGAKGVCAINPILDIDFLERKARLGDPRRRAVRAMPALLQKLAVKHQRPAKSLWRVCRELKPSADPVSVLAELVDRGVDVLVLGSPEDMKAYQQVWFWRRFGARRLSATNRFDLQTVDRLDHGMHIAEGRLKALRIIDEYVLGRFGKGVGSDNG